MPRTLAQKKLDFWFYRLSTICKSLKALYTLSPEKVDAFVDAYRVYDYDWANEEEMIQAFGPDYYAEVKRLLLNWYTVLNHLCALGHVEKMYIPPAIDLSVGIIDNQTLFERIMAKNLKIEKGSKVLDIGCGRGRVASHIATLTGADVTGLNLDPTQLASARKFTEANGLTKQCQFIQADVNDLPLPFKDHSFDAVYHVQVFSIVKDLRKLFKEIHRILKPGGRISCLDWMSLKDYDPSNAHHATLMKKIKPLIGAIGTISADTYAQVMREAGFEIVIDEEPSIDGLQAPLIEKADKFYTRAGSIIEWLVRLKMMPAHFNVLFRRLSQDGEALIEANRMRLVTTTYYIVGQKKG